MTIKFVLLEDLDGNEIAINAARVRALKPAHGGQTKIEFDGNHYVVVTGDVDKVLDVLNGPS